MPINLKQGAGMAAQMAMAYLAAKAHGPQAAAAFLQGIQQRRASDQQQQRQDARQQQLDQSTLQTQQMTREDLAADNRRADEAL